MATLKINAKDVKAIMDAIGSRKRHAYISAAESVTYSGTFWDGGSRDEYTAVDLATGRAMPGVRFDPPQFGGPRVDPVVPIPRGVVIVKHGTFCGKPRTPWIFAHPDDMPRYLPACTELT